MTSAGRGPSSDSWEVVDHPQGLALMLDFHDEPKLWGIPMTPDEAERLAVALSTKAALARLDAP